MTPVTDTADASQPSVDRSAVTRAAIDAALSSQGETDRRLVAVLDEYVASLEAGTAEPIAAVAARHPELSPDLAECLEGVAAIHRAVDAARSPAGVAPDEAVTVDGPAADRATSGTSPPAPRELGDYRLLREIGRGGMGVVYEAEQRALRRRVALKVLPFAAVLDQRQIARFRNEAQAAAGLNHPHIVPVYAIGNERGVHYYAMQHIEGQSLGEAIAELRGADGASPSETAALGSEGAASFGPSNRTPGFFRSVARLGADAADALAHAHELGVVHRDIKPSNLLLDQQGKVWVTDFGLARMQTDLGVTATGDVVGTLRYMSPEQASGRADRVDGRTDVYALGATLYELLTLQHAHRGDNRARLLERLQRDDPIAPRRLNPALPADLENIVLRAMEKDRDARYASAAEMAEDLHRFLDGRPTVARPPTLAQHAAKWTRRHRRLVTVAAIGLAAVTLVTAVSGVFLERARQQTQAALVAAEGHRDRTERLLEQARTLLDRFGVELTDRLASLPGSEAIRRDALASTLAYYEFFLDESRDDPRLAASSAQTLLRAGAISERLGEEADADNYYTQAERVLSELLAAEPQSVALRETLARTTTNRGLLFAEQGDEPRALADLDVAESLRRGLVADEPDSADRMADLAALLSDRAALGIDGESASDARFGEGIELLRKARRAAPDEPNHTRRLGVALHASAVHRRISDPAAARIASDDAARLLRRLAAEHPDVDAYRADLAMSLSGQAALAGDAGDWRGAAERYTEAADELRRLAERQPLAPRHRSELAIALANRGFAHAAAREPAESAKCFRDADRVLASLVRSYPAKPKYLRSHAALWNNRGVVLRDTGQLPEAAEAFARSIEIEERRLAGSAQPEPTSLAVHYANYTQVLGRLNRVEEAARVETKRRALLAGWTGVPDPAAATPEVKP